MDMPSSPLQVRSYSVIGDHGEVIGTGTTNLISAVPGNVINEAAPPAHWWDASRSTFVPIGAQPSSLHTWDWPSHQWVDRSTLGLRRDLKWREIKAARDLAEVSGFPYMGKVIQSDPDSVRRITLAASVSEPRAWTCADNSVLYLDVEGVKGMPAALAKYTDQLHEKARALRARINAAGSPAEIDAISWPG